MHDDGKWLSSLSRALWIDVIWSKIVFPASSDDVTALEYQPDDVPYEYYKEATLRTRGQKRTARITRSDDSIRLLLGRFRISSVWNETVDAKSWIVAMHKCLFKHLVVIQALVTWGGPGLLVVHDFRIPSDSRCDILPRVHFPAVQVLEGQKIEGTKRSVMALAKTSVVKTEFHFFQWMCQTSRRRDILGRWFPIKELPSVEETAAVAASGAGDDDSDGSDAHASSLHRRRALLPKSRD